MDRIDRIDTIFRVEHYNEFRNERIGHRRRADHSLFSKFGVVSVSILSILSKILMFSV